MYLDTLTRRALVGLALAATLVLAACGGGGGHDDAGHSSDKAEASDDFNDADVMFAQMMIPHHEQAVEMAELAPERAADAEIEQLAVAIKDAQDPEIQTMTKWLKAWDRPLEMEHDMGVEDGMADEKQMKELADSSGAAFDELFAELMIAHHEGAVTMAEDVRKQGKNLEVEKLAGQIIETQRAEIADLEKILERL